MTKLVSVTAPRTWDELVSQKNLLPRCDISSTRFLDQHKFYWAYQELVPPNIRQQILFRQLGKKNITLIHNNFPYLKLIRYMPNVQHFCLWSKIGPLSPDKIESILKRKFKHQPYFWFENIEAIKSVPEVWHCHVFVKGN